MGVGRRLPAVLADMSVCAPSGGESEAAPLPVRQGRSVLPSPICALLTRLRHAIGFARTALPLVTRDLSGCLGGLNSSGRSKMKHRPPNTCPVRSKTISEGRFTSGPGSRRRVIGGVIVRSPPGSPLGSTVRSPAAVAAATGRMRRVSESALRGGAGRPARRSPGLLSNRVNCSAP